MVVVVVVVIEEEVENNIIIRVLRNTVTMECSSEVVVRMRI